MNSEPQLPGMDDGIGRQKAKARFTTCYPRHHQPRTLADYERAFNTFLRDTERVRLTLDMSLQQMRDQEQRAQALMRVTPLPFMNRED